MNKMYESISRQVNILHEFILQYIDSDYVYVDIPLYQNIGDWLIAMGAWELLNQSHYKCLAKLRWDDYYSYEITPNTIIILQGGGNFGDLYRGATDARNEVIESYPNNKIVILSQTITYINKDYLEKDTKLYAKHPNLHICARDKESYQFAKSFFKFNNVHLLPDTAMGLYESLPKYNGELKNKELIINRLDMEADILFEEIGDLKDWKNILNDIHFNYVWIPYRVLHKLRNILHFNIFIELERIYTLKCLYSFVKKHIPRYFLRYDKVKTTRLHGYLLASLMHLPVEIKDNKYNKLNNYISTWMK